MRKIAAMLLTAAIGSVALDAQAQDAVIGVSEPMSHGNLTVYFVAVRPDLAAGALRATPSTLAEALEGGQVRVYETGDVNELMVENLGSEEVFVNAGDIVKGGRQDRVLAVSLIIPPHSGRMPISAFCVEQGRWSQRGGETATLFSSALEIAPLRETRLALKGGARMAAVAPASNELATNELATENTVVGDLAAQETGRIVQQRSRGYAGGGGDQGAVWASVAETQRKLGESLAGPVAAAESPSSLQLALENDALKDVRAPYVETLEPRGLEGEDLVGAVFAVNGRVVSAEIYGSNALFRKMWPKLLRAASIEAISERAGAVDQVPPSSQVVRGFLNENASGEMAVTPLPADLEMAEKRSNAVTYSETRRTDGEMLHRSYIANY